MNSICIFSFASVRHVVDSYHESIDSLKVDALTVNHIGLSLDLWYNGNAFLTYQKYGYPVYNIPRVSGIETSWWTSSNIMEELMDSINSIELFINDLIIKFNPKIVIFADDTGPMEIFLINLFNKNNIPILLIEHGYDFAFFQQPTMLTQLRNGVKQSLTLINKMITLFYIKIENIVIKKIICTKRDRISVARSQLPQVRPFGHNGKYLICSFSELTKKILIKKGIKSDIIRNTGYPYFDKVIKFGKTISQNYCKNKKILIISTGFGKFGDYERGNKLYIFVLKLRDILHDDYDIYVRLKPGEDLSSFINPDLFEKINKLNIKFDDNKTPSYEAIINYCLVIGEPSQVLIEAILLNRPVILLKFDNPLENKYKFSLELIMEKCLHLKTIKNFNFPTGIIDDALSENYLNRLKENLKSNEYLLFFNLDGNAGYRVSRVILEMIENDDYQSSVLL